MSPTNLLLVIYSLCSQSRGLVTNTLINNRIQASSQSVHVWTVSQVLALQEQVNLPEMRSYRGVSLPTLTHQVIDFFGAVEWLWQILLEMRNKFEFQRTVLVQHVLRDNYQYFEVIVTYNFSKTHLFQLFYNTSYVLLFTAFNYVTVQCCFGLSFYLFETKHV